MTQCMCLTVMTFSTNERLASHSKHGRVHYCKSFSILRCKTGTHSLVSQVLLMQQQGQLAEELGMNVQQFENDLFQRWRLFFLACAELFGYNDGEEWLVAHYRFRRVEDGGTP